MPQHPLIIYAGTCNLCESTVRFIIRRDPEARFRFASVRSEKAGKLCQKHGISADELETVVLLKAGEVHTRRDAFVEIAREMGGIWKLLTFLNAIPRPLRDGVYSVISSHRYRWFGRKRRCWPPPEDIRSRFLQ